MVNRVSFCFIIILLVLTGCSRIDNKIIQEFRWKYGSGHHIGDMITFTDDNLKSDTIYFEKKPVALITYCGKGIFRSSAILEIEDIRTGQTGTYHQK